MFSIKILMVWGCRNLFVISLEFIDKLRKMVIMLMRVFCVVLDKCFIMLYLCIKLLK